MVGRQVGLGLRQHDRARSRPTTGVTGWGEVCPLGPFYLPAYGAGARTGIAELAPHLIGLDPRELGRLNRRMDAALKGHPYVKSAIDMACWDILGKAAGLPVCDAARRPLRRGRRPLPRDLAGELGEDGRRASPRYRAEGYRKFQLKVGGDPDEDIARIRAVRGEAASRATCWSPTPTPAG